MKNIGILLFLLTANFANAEDIGQYKLYATDHSSDDKSEFAAYVKNDDPCVQIKNLKTNKEFRFCKMTKGIDLTDDPKLSPYAMYFSENRLHFFVTAYWADQTCVIKLWDMSLNCEYKNRPKDDEEAKAEVKKILEGYKVAVPLSVKHVETQRIKGIRGQFRLILNDSELNPCFTIEHYTDDILFSYGSTTVKHVCTVRYKHDNENYVIPLLGFEAENFTWQDDHLAFEIPSAGNREPCKFPLPFTDQSEAICTK